MDCRYEVPNQQIGQILPKSIIYYAYSLGFRADNDTPLSKILHHPDRYEFELEIPTESSSPVYFKKIWQAVSELAKFENRQPMDVVSDISYKSPSDIVVCRELGEVTEDGAIPLLDIIDMLKSLRTMLNAAAHTAISENKNTYHKILNRREAQDFINQCRMGQTERGSFVAKIICPHPLAIPDGQTNLTQFGDMVSSTLTRRVTTTFIQSAYYLNKCLERENNYDINSIIKEKSASLPVVISGNFCEALAKLEPTYDNDQLEINMRWGGGTPRNMNNIPNLYFQKDHFDKIQYIADQLRPVEDFDNIKMIGKIKSLDEDIRAPSPEEAQTEFTAFFNFEGDTIRTKVVLTGEDRDKAYLAIKEFKNVLISGRLERAKKQYIIHNPKIIELSEDSSQE